MTSVPRVAAFSVYKSQPKNISDCNSDTNGTSESYSKRQRSKENIRNTDEKQTVVAENKLEGEASVAVIEKKKRGRKRKSVVVDQEKSDARNETLENGGKQSDEVMEDVTEADEIAPWSKVNTQCFESKEYSCGTEAAEEAFKWLLNPIQPATFFEKIFEKGPHYLPRKNTKYYGGLFASKDFDKIIRENRLDYNKEIDVVAYVDGQRKPLENGTIVYPDFVWDSYNEGYSVRMRNPQAYHQPLWQLCSLLQEYFSSCVGANMYLTPANSQGFPPHWDDIDAFILQLEGKKHWKVYSPRNPKEELPQLSSPDLDEDTIGEPILEQELSAGDMLYIPRGYIHQAHATDEYSLHITISTNQQNTWSDFLHHGIEAALEKATEENVELRKSLPKDYFDFAGYTTPQTDSSLDSVERSAFRKKALQLTQEVLKHFTVDSAADVHAAHFIHGCMRPFFNKEEGMRSIHWNGNRFRNGTVKKISSLTPESRVRWIRKRAFRLVLDEEGPKLFHTLANGKNFKEVDTGFLEVDDSAVPAVCALFQKHPEYIRVKDLPVQGNLDDKRQFAEILYYNGFLVTDQPLPPEDD